MGGWDEMAPGNRGMRHSSNHYMGMNYTVLATIGAALVDITMLLSTMVFQRLWRHQCSDNHMAMATIEATTIVVTIWVQPYGVNCV